MEEQLDPITGLPIKRFDVSVLNAKKLTSTGSTQSSLFHGTEAFDEELDFGLMVGLDRNSIRATNQTGMQEFGNFLGAAAGSVVGGTIESVGYLAELINPLRLLKEEDEKFGNILTEFGQGITKTTGDAFKVYQEDSNNPWDSEFWAANGASLASSLTMLIPAKGGVALLGKVAKLTKAGKIASRAAKMKPGSKIANYMNGAKGVSAAIISRHMESSMEASQIYDSTFKREMEASGDEEIAKSKASKAAANTYKFNWLALATDIPQYMMLFRGVSAAKGGFKEFGKDLITTMGNESIEEVYQYGVGKEAEERQFDPKDSFGERVFDYLEDPELKHAAILGAAGGGIFTVAGKAMQKTLSTLATRNQNIQVAAINKGRVAAAVQQGDIFVEQLSAMTPEQREAQKDMAREDLKDPNLSEEDKRLVQDRIETIEEYEIIEQGSESKEEAEIKRKLHEQQKTSIREIENARKKKSGILSKISRAFGFAKNVKDTSTAAKKIELEARKKAAETLPEDTKAEKEVKKATNADISKAFEELGEAIKEHLEDPNAETIPTTVHDATLEQAVKEEVEAEFHNEVANKSLTNLQSPDGKEELERLKKEKLVKEISTMTMDELAAKRKGTSDEAKAVQKRIEEEAAKETDENIPSWEITKAYKSKNEKMIEKLSEMPYTLLNETGKTHQQLMDEHYDAEETLAKITGEEVEEKVVVENDLKPISEDDLSDIFGETPTKEKVEKQVQEQIKEDIKEKIQEIEEVNKPEDNGLVFEDISNLLVMADRVLFNLKTVNGVKGIFLTGTTTRTNKRFIPLTDIAKEGFKTETVSKLKEGKSYLLYDLEGNTIESRFVSEWGIDVDFVNKLHTLDYKNLDVTLRFAPNNEYNERHANAGTFVMQAVVTDETGEHVIGVVKADYNGKDKALKTLREEMWKDKSITKTVRVKKIYGGQFHNSKNPKVVNNLNTVKPDSVPLIIGVAVSAEGGRYMDINMENLPQDKKDFILENGMPNDNNIKDGVVYFMSRNLAGQLVWAQAYTLSVKQAGLQDQLLKSLNEYDNLKSRRMVTAKLGTDKYIPDVDGKLQQTYGGKRLFKKGADGKITNVKTGDRNNHEKFLVPGAILAIPNDSNAAIAGKLDGYKTIFKVLGKEGDGFLIEFLDENLDSTGETSNITSVAVEHGRENIFVHFAYNYFEHNNLRDKPSQVDKDKINIKEYDEQVVDQRVYSKLNPKQNFTNASIALDMNYKEESNVKDTQQTELERIEASRQKEIDTALEVEGKGLIKTKDLTGKGIEKVDKRGEVYKEGSKVIDEFIPTPKGYKDGGVAVIIKQRKPQINKDGVMIQAAEVVVMEFESKEEGEKYIRENPVKVNPKRIARINAKYDAQIAALKDTQEASNNQSKIDKIEAERQAELETELNKKAKDIPVKKEYYKDVNNNDVTVTTYRSGNKTAIFTKSNNLASKDGDLEGLVEESQQPYKTENVTSKLENKINAKYDAQRDAATKPQTTGENRRPDGRIIGGKAGWKIRFNLTNLNQDYQKVVDWLDGYFETHSGNKKREFKGESTVGFYGYNESKISAWKLLSGGEINENEFTIYLGSNEDTLKFIEDVKKSEIVSLLDRKKHASTDVEISDGFYGRVDMPSLPKSIPTPKQLSNIFGRKDVVEDITVNGEAYRIIGLGDTTAVLRVSDNKTILSNNYRGLPKTFGNDFVSKAVIEIARKAYPDFIGGSNTTQSTEQSTLQEATISQDELIQAQAENIFTSDTNISSDGYTPKRSIEAIVENLKAGNPDIGSEIIHKGNAYEVVKVNKVTFGVIDESGKKKNLKKDQVTLKQPTNESQEIQQDTTNQDREDVGQSTREAVQQEKPIEEKQEVELTARERHALRNSKKNIEEGKTNVIAEQISNLKEFEVEAINKAKGDETVEEFVAKEVDNVNKGKKSSLRGSVKKIILRIAKSVANFIVGFAILSNLSFMDAGLYSRDYHTQHDKIVAASNVENWEDYKLELAETNKLTNLQIIQNFHTGDTSQYLVVDKSNARMHLYRGNKLVDSFEVGTGKVKGDEQTKTVVRNGKVRWNEGNLQTGAGKYTVIEESKYFGEPMFTLKNDLGIQVASAIHVAPSRRNKYFNNNNIEDNRMSYGCVNGKCSDMRKLSKEHKISGGENVYILPDNPDNFFQIKDKQLQFISKNTKVNRTYKQSRTINDLYFELSQEVLTEDTYSFVNHLIDNKVDLMQDLNLSDTEFNDLTKIAFGIFGQESSFNTISGPRSAYGQVRDLAGIALGKDVSAGATQLRFSNIRKYKEKLAKYGLKSNKDLLTLEKSSIATMFMLADLYKNEVPVRLRGEISTLIPLLYNNKTIAKKYIKGEYNDRVFSYEYVTKVNAFSNKLSLFGSFAKEKHNDRLNTPDVKYLEAGKGKYEKWNKEEELTWLKEKLPNVPVHVLTDLKEVIKNAPDAYGAFYESAIYLMNNATRGASYHEAFHAVFTTMLNENQQKDILRQAYTKFGKELGISKAEFEADLNKGGFEMSVIDGVERPSGKLEEMLANEFQSFVMNNGRSLGLGAKIKKFFKRMINTMRSLISNKLTIDELYHRINDGFYRNTKPARKEQSNPKYLEVPGFTPTEQEEAVEALSNVLIESLIQHSKVTGKTGAGLVKTLLGSKNKSVLTGEAIPYSVTNKLYDHLDDLRKKGTLTEAKEAQVYKLIENLTVKGKGDMFYNTELTLLTLRSLARVGMVHNEKNNFLTKGIGLVESNVVNRNSERDEALDTTEDGREAWQRNSKGISALEFMDNELMMKLYNIPERSNKGDVVSNFIGLNKTRSPQWTYKQIQRATGNSIDSNDMMDKLANSSIPEMQDVIELTKEDSTLKTSLFIIAQRVQPKFITIVEDGKKTISIPSNINSLVNNISSEYVASIFNNPELYSVQGVNFKKGKQLKALADQAIALKGTDAYISKVDQLFNEMGLNISVDYLNRLGAKSLEAFMGSESSKMYNFVQSFAKGEDPIALGNLSAIKELAKLLSNFYPQQTQDAHRTSSGSKVFEWIQASFMGRLINKFNNKNYWKEEIHKYMNDPTMAKLPLFQEIKKAHGRGLQPFKFVMLSELIQKGKSKGIEYSDMNEKDVYTVGLNWYENQMGNKYRDLQKAIFPLPVHSDAPSMTGLEVTVSRFARAEDSPGSGKGFLDKLFDVAHSEIMRVFDNSLDNIKSVKKNNKFLYFDVLNKHREKIEKLHKDGDVAGLKIMLIGGGDVRGILMNDVAKRIKEEKAKMVELGIATFKDGVYKFENNIANGKQGKVFNDFVAEYVVNYMVHYGQIATIFNGDLSFYKHIGDFYKRAKQVYSPGIYQDVHATYTEQDGTEHRVRKNYNNKILDTVYHVNTKFNETVQAMLGTEHPAHDEWDASNERNHADKTDAQSFIDLFRLREVMIGLKRWNDEQQGYYDDLMAGEFNLTKMSGILKPFYFSHHKIGDRIVPMQNKNSEMVILPVFAKKNSPFYNPKYREMLEEMGYTFDEEGNNITDTEAFEQARYEGKHTDQFSFDTAIKVGQDKSKPGGIKDAPNVVFNNEDWRLQMETPEHHVDSTVVFATQLRKHMMNNIDMEGTYILNGEEISGKDLLKKYNDAIVGNIEDDFNKLKETLNKDKFEDLVDMMKEEILSRNLGDEYLDSLEVFKDENGELTTKLPIWHPLHLYRMEALLNSVVTNRVINKKIKRGVTLANISAYGYEKEPEIKFNDRGGIDYFEAYIPVYDTFLMSEQFLDENGYIDVAKVEAYNPKLLEGMVWRVPNEDKYSTVRIKVIGFLPQEINGIVLPAEITKLAGLDYDIDKMYGFMYSDTNKELSKEEQRYNDILDIMTAIMTDSKTAESILYPGSYNDIVNTNKFIRVKEAQAKGMKNEKGKLVTTVEEIEAVAKPILNPSYHAEVANRMLVGKNLIGIFANSAVGHAVFQHIPGLNILFPVKVNGKILTKLNGTKDTNGNLISKNHAQAVAAVVDNGNDPQMGYSNINSYTVDVASMMIQLGTPWETVQLFLSQPIMKKFVNEHLRAGGNAQSELATLKNPYYSELFNAAFSGLGATTNFSKIAKGKILPNLIINVTDKQLRDNIGKTNRTSELFQIGILTSFLQYKKTSSQYSNLVQATKLAEGGLGPTDAHSLQKIDYVDPSGSDNYSNITGVNTLFDSELYFQILNKVLPNGRDLLIEAASLPDSNKGNFKNIRSHFSSLKSSNLLSVAEIDFLNKNYLDYLASESLPYSQELIDELPERLERYKHTTKNGDYAPFINRLKIEVESAKERSFIVYSGMTGQDKIVQNQIKNAWKRMLVEGSVVEQALAKDLVQYAFMQSGFRMSPNSFGNLIPASYFYTQTEFTKKLKSAINSAENGIGSTYDFKEFFVQNHYRSLGYIGKIDPNSKGTTLAINTLTLANEKGFTTNEPGFGSVYVEYVKHYNESTYDTDLYMKIDAVTGKKGEVKATYMKIKEKGVYKKRNTKANEYSSGKMFTQWNIDSGNKVSIDVTNIDDTPPVVNETDLLSKINEEIPEGYLTEEKNNFMVVPKQSVDVKAQSKAKIATQYIGFADNIQGSSTDLYRVQAGEFANTGYYSSDDVIFASVGGKRGDANLRKVQQTRTIKEVIKAIEAGATVLLDNKAYVESNNYNEGEKRMVKNLDAKGYSYSEITVDGHVIGVWNKGKVIKDSPKAIDAQQAIEDKLNELVKQKLKDGKAEKKCS